MSSSVWKMVHVLRGWADISLLQTVSHEWDVSLFLLDKINSTSSRDKNMLMTSLISTVILQGSFLINPRLKVVMMESHMKHSKSQFFSLSLISAQCQTHIYQDVPKIWSIRIRHRCTLRSLLNCLTYISICGIGSSNRSTGTPTRIPSRSWWKTLRNPGFTPLRHEIQDLGVYRQHFWTRTVAQGS